MPLPCPHGPRAGLSDVAHLLLHLPRMFNRGRAGLSQDADGEIRKLRRMLDFVRWGIEQVAESGRGCPEGP